MVQSIIRANNNLEESNDANDWSQMGRDISELQRLVKQLESVIKEENGRNNAEVNTIQNENTITIEQNIIN
ncbi:MAG: hypothetical protein HFJ54_05150 [Clostridia bacterium]|nr:hypothetical protein [Clostridia bacterium]